MVGLMPEQPKVGSGGKRELQELRDACRLDGFEDAEQTQRVSRWVLAEVERLEAENARLREALGGLLESGIEFDDERLRYIVVQVDREDWEQAREALAGGPAEGEDR
jgi:hypothetical protein